MSLSDKEKRQLQAKRIRTLKYKATGLYLYHPATDSWIPAQCDDEGRLVIDPSDLDTRYHKKAEDLVMTSEKKLKWSATEYIDNYDEISGTYTGLTFKSRDRMFFHGHQYFFGHGRYSSVGGYLEFTNTGQFIRTAKDFYWKVHDGSDYLDVLKFVRANPPYMDILKAGDILPVAGKTCGSATYPFVHVEGNVVRAGTKFSAGYGHLDPTTADYEYPGDIRYNSALNKLQVRTAEGWETITSVPI